MISLTSFDPMESTGTGGFRLYIPRNSTALGWKGCTRGVRQMELANMCRQLDSRGVEIWSRFRYRYQGIGLGSLVLVVVVDR